MEIKHKSKPINRRKVVQKMLLSLVMGVIFALAFVTTVIFFGPTWKNVLGIKDEGDLVVQVAEKETEEPVDEEMREKSKAAGRVMEDNQQVFNTLYQVAGKTMNGLVRVSESVSTEYHGHDEAQGNGCGIIVTKNKKEIIILTSPNAINSPKNVVVSFCNGQIVKGELRVKDKETGIAIIRVTAELLDKDTKETITTVNMGSSDTLQRGEYTTVIGNPLGEFHTALVGQFSSVNSSVGFADREYTLLETTIPGKYDMEGFLLNQKGNVVGIIDHSKDEVGDVQTVKAIGMSEIASLIEKLCNHEKIPYLGVEISSISPETARLYNIPEGVYIEYTHSPSPAAEAGLQRGDIITGIGKKEVKVGKYFYQTLMDIPAGSTVKIHYMRFRNGEYKNMTADVTVGELSTN